MGPGNIANADTRLIEGLKNLWSTETAENLQESLARSVDTAQDMKTDQADMVNPQVAAKIAEKQKPLAARKVRAPDRSESVLVRQKFENAANDFCGKNRQFTAQDLLDLLEKIETAEPKLTEKEVLAAVEAKYTNPLLVSKALEFLKDNITDKDLKSGVTLLQADYARDNEPSITTSYTIISEVQAGVDKKLGTHEELLNIHFKFKEAPSFKDMFDELTKKYNQKQIIGISDYLRQSVGAELRASNSTIEPGKLVHDINEVKMLRVLSSLYRFSNTCFPLIKKECEKESGI